MKPVCLSLLVLFASPSWSHSADTTAQPSAEILRVLNEFAGMDAGQFSLPPRTPEERERFLNWCAPLRRQKPPAVAPLLLALRCLDGESPMLAAFIIGTSQWDEGVQELLALCDSDDQRLRDAAREVLPGIYLGWEPKVANAFPKIDLPKMLRRFHESHGPISRTVYEAIGFALTDPQTTDGPNPLIDPKWFNSEEWPPSDVELNDRTKIGRAAKNSRWAVRAAAAQAAAETGEFGVVQMLLADADQRVVRTACEALRRRLENAGDRLDATLVSPEFTAAQQKLIRHEDARVRAVALACYAQIVRRGNAELLSDSILEKALTDPAGVVRETALQTFRMFAVRTLSDAESNRILKMAIEDRDIGVRCAAARTIARQGAEAARKELSAWFDRNRSQAPVNRFIELAIRG